MANRTGATDYQIGNVGTYAGTSSWTNNTVSSSYSPAQPSYSASVSTQFGTKQDSLTAGGKYTITSSWATQSISASYAPVEPNYSSSVSTYFGTKQNTLTNTTYTITASYATTSSFSMNSGATATYTSSLWGTASWAQSASVAISASYAPGSSAATYTSSLWGTASWAQTASVALLVVSQSAESLMLWVPSGSIPIGAIGFYSLTSKDFVISQQSSSTGGIAFNTSGSQRIYITTDGTIQLSGSVVVSGSLSASYATTASYATNAGTTATYTSSLWGTSSWAQSASVAITASFATNAGTTATYTSSLWGTASWANNSISTSYVISQSVESLMLWLPTGSTPIGAIGFYSPSSTNFIISHQSSSTGGIAFNTSGSQRVYITTDGTIQLSGSVVVSGSLSASYATTASFSLNAGTTATYTSSLWGTASWAVSASWAPGGNGVTDGGSYNITSSWATQSISASYAPVEPIYSASVSTQFGTKQNTLVVGNNYTITSSWATNAVSASYVPPSVLWTGSALLLTDSLILSGSTGISPLKVIANLNNYAEINNRNVNIGVSASADITATNDSGSDTSYFIDMGINSSTYNLLNNVGGVNDAYIYTTGSSTSNLYVGNVAPSGKTYLFAGGYTNTGSGLIVSSTLVSTTLTSSFGFLSCSLYGKVIPQIFSVTSSVPAIAPNSVTTEYFDATNLAAALTMSNPTGTPNNFQKLMVRIKDNGTSRGIQWGTSYQPGILTTLPSATIASKWMNCGFIYNTSGSGFFQLAAFSQEV